MGRALIQHFGGVRRDVAAHLLAPETAGAPMPLRTARNVRLGSGAPRVRKGFRLLVEGLEGEDSWPMLLCSFQADEIPYDTTLQPWPPLEQPSITWPDEWPDLPAMPEWPDVDQTFRMLFPWQNFDFETWLKKLMEYNQWEIMPPGWTTWPPWPPPAPPVWPPVDDWPWPPVPDFPAWPPANYQPPSYDWDENPDPAIWPYGPKPEDWPDWPPWPPPNPEGPSLPPVPDHNVIIRRRRGHRLEPVPARPTWYECLLALRERQIAAGMVDEQPKFWDPPDNTIPREVDAASYLVDMKRWFEYTLQDAQAGALAICGSFLAPGAVPVAHPNGYGGVLVAMNDGAAVTAAATWKALLAALKLMRYTWHYYGLEGHHVTVTRKLGRSNYYAPWSDRIWEAQSQYATNPSTNEDQYLAGWTLYTEAQGRKIATVLANQFVYNSNLNALQQALFRAHDVWGLIVWQNGNYDWTGSIYDPRIPVAATPTDFGRTLPAGWENNVGDYGACMRLLADQPAVSDPLGTVDLPTPPPTPVSQESASGRGGNIKISNVHGLRKWNFTHQPEVA